MTRSGWLSLLVLGAFLLFFLSVPFRFEFGENLVLGWAMFLYRMAPLVQFSPSGVLTAIACLALLTWGLNAFLRWLSAASALAAADEGARAVWPWRWTLSVLGLIVLAFVAGISAIGVTHQTGWLFNSPEPLWRDLNAERTQSTNNLKQIALAFHNYEAVHNRMPPPGTFDGNGRGLHGWQTALLPFIEQDELYKTIDQSRPWDDSVNAKAFGTVVKTYLRPTDEPQMADGYALTHIASNVRVYGGNATVTIKQIHETRGTGNTILGGEVAGNFKPWGHPANWRDPALGLNRSPNGFGHRRMQGATMLFLADGSVRWVTNDADPEFLMFLSEPIGKE